MAGLAVDNFNSKLDSVFQIDVEPARFDILQSIPAIDFDQAWSNRVEPTVYRTTAAYFISRDDLIRNKLAVRRHRDLDDVERLQAAKRTVG